MVPSSPESFRNWRQWKSGCDLIFCNHIFHYKAWQENFIYSFLVFWKKLLQRFINLKIIIAKCDKKLLQSVTDLKKWGRIYYKVLLVLQGMTIITKWHVTRANYYRLIVHHFFCELKRNFPFCNHPVKYQLSGNSGTWWKVLWFWIDFLALAYLLIYHHTLKLYLHLMIVLFSVVFRSWRRFSLFFEQNIWVRETNIVLYRLTLFAEKLIK